LNQAARFRGLERGKTFLKKTLKNIWSLEIKSFIFAAPKRRTDIGLLCRETERKSSLKILMQYQKRNKVKTSNVLSKISLRSTGKHIKIFSTTKSLILAQDER
jgi:hypothetical protein